MPENVARILHLASSGYAGGSERGALSLKTMRGGHALYEVPGGAFRVDDERFLVLNDAQPYEVLVERHVESFCVFFDAAFAGGVLRALRLDPTELLDEPFASDARVPELLIRTFPMTGDVGRTLQAAREASAGGWLTPERLEEGAARLLEGVWRLSGEVRAQQGRLPWSRASTRAEVERRVTRARDFAEAYLAGDVSLVTLARVANLAPHHFLRAFRAVVGETPHAYVTRRRLERARLLIRNGESVGRAALDVGFTSPTSFTAAYKKRFGRAPSTEQPRNFEEVRRAEVP